MLVRVPDVVYSDENGLQWLAGLATRGFRSGSIDIEVPDGVWIDANLRAAWGAIVNRWREKDVHYRFVRGGEPYAFDAEVDRPTCLPYETFSIHDEESWAAYALRVLLNDGKLSILSDDGLWELSSGQVRKWNLDSSFPGTLITITVRTDDQGFYRLRSEVRL